MKPPELSPTIFAFAIFAGILLMLELGRYVGARRRTLLMRGGAAGIGAVEAAIFTLLGLLIAFTFQGAASRFDSRRDLIVQEANNIGTAWLRIDLLPAEVQPRMHELFRQYLDSRLETYRQIRNFDALRKELSHTSQIQAQIWKLAMDGQKAEEGRAIVVSLLPALNAMFDIVTTRTMATKLHPPVVMFVMLAVMGCAAGFLAGHGMSGTQVRSWVHSIGFAAVLAVTVYVILDMEFPRLGHIRVDDFDQVLVDLRQGMN